MTLQAGSEPASESRRNRRANVFLSAVIHLDGSSFPVRIRNLSATGALAEGDAMPPMASRVRLQRGPYNAPATIVWSDGAACGVRFEASVPVDDWIAYGRGHNGQQRVDAILAGREGGDGDSCADIKGIVRVIDRLQAGEQLAMLAAQLQQIGTELAARAALADTDIAALQKLDIVTQRLAGLSAMLRANAG